MVGIVIVTHSEQLAAGVVALAAQMTAGQETPIAGAGGTDDGGIGTSLEKIQAAVEAAWSDDGVLVLMDLGSAVMTTEMLLEMLPKEQRARVRMSNAPLVEGAIAAATTAAQGADLDAVQRSAETALDLPKIPEHVEAPPEALPEAPLEGRSKAAELVVPNPVGLHARPAALFVRAAAAFQSHITVQNISQGRMPVDAKSMMQVASQGTARQGETIRVVARGEDAAEAIAALSELVRAGFGEMGPSGPAPRPAPAQPKVKAGTVSPQVGVEAPTAPPAGRIRGIGVSEGLAVAPAFVVRANGHHVPSYTVDDIAAELQRYDAALQAALAQLAEVQRSVAAAADAETARIFEFHQLMLQDPLLDQGIRARIRIHSHNAEAAVDAVLGEWAERFAGIDDDVMRVRAADVQDVRSRLLSALRGKAANGLLKLPGPSIVVAADLAPSQTALLDRAHVRGLATAVGGATSHTAILARMLGIPAVVGLGPSILGVATGDTLALDGGAGWVEVAPPARLIEEVAARERRREAAEVEALARALEPAVTTDGRRVEVAANIGDVGSAREAVEYGAEAVGLLRTEFLYLDRTALPDEEEQYQAYRDILGALGDRPLVVRTVDVGGDKQLPYLDIGPEMNPFLGVRAIRLVLERPDIFQPQLRAILRAAVGRSVRVMFPMVATWEEVVRARTAVDEARAALLAEGLPIAEAVELGIMVETPAAAILAPSLAPELDFFSIGSNDLTQYTLAVDRGNERLQHLYRPLDPTVLFLIKRVIDAGHAAGKWVGLCGELAGDRLGIPVLLGLGLDEFSMTPRAIPMAKRLLRRLDSSAARRLAGEVLLLPGAEAVERAVADFLAQMGEH